MVQKGTKTILIFAVLLAGLLVAAQVQAGETSASASSASVQAAPAGTSEANDQATDWFHHPAPWLDQGGDFRFREHFGYNWKTLRNDQKVAGLNVSRWYWERYRTRLWDTFKLNEDTTINTRFTWEFREWNDPEFLRQRTDFDEIIMDTFNLTQKNFLGLPTTAVIGRQDIKLGEGWLVAEGTPAPLEGSRTLYFDALRFTWDLGEKKTLDTIYIDQHPKSDWWLKPINDREKYVTLEQEEGAILYYTDKSNKDISFIKIITRLKSQV